MRVSVKTELAPLEDLFIFLTTTQRKQKSKISVVGKCCIRLRMCMSARVHVFLRACVCVLACVLYRDINQLRLIIVQMQDVHVSLTKFPFALPTTSD